MPDTEVSDLLLEASCVVKLRKAFQPVNGQFAVQTEVLFYGIAFLRWRSGLAVDSSRDRIDFRLTDVGLCSVDDKWGATVIRSQR
jgi:hypothetical protein